MGTHPWAQVKKAREGLAEEAAGPSGLHRPSDEVALETVQGFGNGQFDSDALTNGEKWATITGAVRQLAKIAQKKPASGEGAFDQEDEDLSDTEKPTDQGSPEVTEALNDKMSSSEEEEEAVKSPSYGRTPPDTLQKRSTRKKFPRTK